ncbi:MAG: hypothetical protein RMZ69_30245 [Nostoc sp. ChiQUE01a]|nr:hypothetical protein [Nostoc sp. ChiQUE01a]
MSISSYLNKKLLIILLCFGMTGTSLASDNSKCQVTGYLFVKKGVLRENISNSLIIDEIRSPKIINRVIQELKLSNINSKSLLPEELMRNLKVEKFQSLEYSEIFNISYSHTDLNLAAEVINSVMNNYIEESALQFKQKAAISKKIIETDLAKTKEQIRMIKQVLRKVCESRYPNKDEISKHLNNLNQLHIKYENLLTRLQEILIAENQSLGNKYMTANARILVLADSNYNK